MKVLLDPQSSYTSSVDITANTVIRVKDDHIVIGGDRFKIHSVLKPTDVEKFLRTIAEWERKLGRCWEPYGGVCWDRNSEGPRQIGSFERIKSLRHPFGELRHIDITYRDGSYTRLETISKAWGKIIYDTLAKNITQPIEMSHDVNTSIIATYVPERPLHIIYDNEKFTIQKDSRFVVGSGGGKPTCIEHQITGDTPGSVRTANLIPVCAGSALAESLREVLISLRDRVYGRSYTQTSLQDAIDLINADAEGITITLALGTAPGVTITGNNIRYTHPAISTWPTVSDEPIPAEVKPVKKRKPAAKKAEPEIIAEWPWPAGSSVKLSAFGIKWFVDSFVNQIGTITKTAPGSDSVLVQWPNDNAVMCTKKMLLLVESAMEEPIMDTPSHPWPWPIGSMVKRKRGGAVGEVVSEMRWHGDCDVRWLVSQQVGLGYSDQLELISLPENPKPSYPWPIGSKVKDTTDGQIREIEHINGILVKCCNDRNWHHRTNLELVSLPDTTAESISTTTNTEEIMTNKTTPFALNTTSFDPSTVMDKLVGSQFSPIDGIVWDLTTGLTGIKTERGIFTISEAAMIEEPVDAEGKVRKPKVTDANWQITNNPIDFMSMTMPAFAVATPMSEVKVMDMLVNAGGDPIGWIIKKEAASFRVMKIDGTVTIQRPNKVTVFGMSAAGPKIVRSMMNMSGMAPATAATTDAQANPMAGMMPMLMAAMLAKKDGKGGKLDMEKLLPMMMLMGGMPGMTGMNGMNPMMMLAMTGSGDMEKMLPLMMCMGMPGMTGGAGMGGMNPMMMGLMMSALGK